MWAATEGWGVAIHAIHIRRQIDQSLLALERSVGAYRRAVDLYHRQRIQLERGMLTDEVMPEAYLEEILDHLQKKGHMVAPIRWYYRYAKVELLVDLNSKLAYRTMIKGVSNIPYLKYKLRYFPVPFGENLLKTLKGKDSIALNSMNRASFTPISCEGREPSICEADIEQTIDTCETDIILGKPPLKCLVDLEERGNRSNCFS